MTQEEFDRWVIDAAKQYNDPPDENLSDLWTSIDDQRIDAQRIDAQRVAANAPLRLTVGQSTRWYQQSWIRMAAVLVVGVALGRVSSSFNAPRANAPTTAALFAEPAVVTASNVSNASPRVLDAPDAERYLGQTVALLASLQSDTWAARGDTLLAARANTLLSTTRFLLDSPNAADPNVRGLLEDLELVLVQIVQIPSSRSASDVELIHQAMKQRDVMPRLRTAVANLNPAD